MNPGIVQTNSTVTSRPIARIFSPLQAECCPTILGKYPAHPDKALHRLVWLPQLFPLTGLEWPTIENSWVGFCEMKPESSLWIADQIFFTKLSSSIKMHGDHFVIALAITGRKAPFSRVIGWLRLTHSSYHVTILVALRDSWHYSPWQSYVCREAAFDGISRWVCLSMLWKGTTHKSVMLKLDYGNIRTWDTMLPTSGYPPTSCVSQPIRWPPLPHSFHWFCVPLLKCVKCKLMYHSYCFELYGKCLVQSWAG